jgi:hypothetical protein
VVFGIVFGLLFPQLPGPLAFCASLTAAVGIALYQGHGERVKPLGEIAFTPNAGRIFLFLAAIYVFKDTVAASGLITSISRLGDSGVMLVLTFILLPFIAGLITGLIVAFVGLTFPLLIGIALHSPLQEYFMPMMVLAMIAGTCGQLLSPMHVCLVVTAEFFTITLPGLLRSLFLPVMVLCLMGALWALLLLVFMAIRA